MSIVYGRLVAPDERDKQYPMRELVAALAVRTSYTWRPGPILNQGSTPECVAYAWEQWLLCSPTRTKNGPAPDEIYHRAQQLDEWSGEDYSGTSVRAGAKVMLEQNRIAEYRWADTPNDVREWVLQRGPVVLGTSWYEGMETVDQYGLVHVSGSVLGGHAYLCIGYSNWRGAFRCVNSWGKEWGQNGRFWLEYEALSNLLANDGEACAAVEKTA